MDSQTVESTVKHDGSQFSYITSYESNLEKLKVEVEKLKDKKKSVQQSVDEAGRNGEKIENIVQIWLKRVDEAVGEARKLIQNDDHAKDQYFIRYFLNLRFRHQQSKKFEKMAQKIHQVLAEGNFDRISKPSTLKEIQQVLKDPNIHMIGLRGIEGVGKTTLVKDLALEVKKDGSFDAVVMAEITDSPDVENIQGQIANALGLEFDEEIKEDRVAQLRQRIRREKNILIILDDIWEKLDLVGLGIPFGDDHKGCKLLLTSQYHNVLKRQMGTQKDFKLEVLSDEESWKLFEKIVGNSYIERKNIKTIAQDVAKCCNGLPLLIVIVAKTLRRNDVSTWKEALNQLKGLDEQGLFKEVVCPLVLGYNYLESREIKLLFLFIVSFGDNRIHTEELFTCFWGLKGLYGSFHKLTEGRKQYHKLIEDLKASSLLLDHEPEYVKMHYVVRDMAKSIASRTPQTQTYEVQKFKQMDQWDIDQLKKCHYINLTSYNIHELHGNLDCPDLKLMSLRRGVDYLEIPDNFFSGISEVQVLNLHGMMFAPSPPSSLRLLTNLISLNLYGCVLEDIAIVAELTSLEILTLERSEIQELPKEIRQLVHLRMLNLTNCYQLKTVPKTLISSLTHLEELYMGNCNIQWEVEGGNRETNNASLGELRNLNNLTTLDLSIQDASVLPTDMDVFAKLQGYNIFIGNMWKWPSLWRRDAFETSRTLKLADSLNTNIFLNSGVKKLFPTVEDLSLDKLNLADNRCELNGKTTFPELRHLHIQNDEASRNLETLILHRLQNMEDVSYSPLPAHSFEKLRVIKAKHCDKLKKLLPYSLAKNLSQLHEMKISKCEVMEEIIFEENLEDEKEFPKIMLHKLHSLTLDRLSMLCGFILPLTTKKDDQSMSMPLFDQKVAMPNLQSLELCSINTCKIWDDKLPHHSCIQHLTSLKIDWCCGLTNLFTSSVAIALVKLHHLRIANCPKLERIFVSEEKVTIFPNLEILVISDNDNLKSIWPNLLAPNSFGKLKQLQIFGTKIPDHVFPNSMIELGQLQVLQISRCRIENIVEKNSPDVQVCLKKLEVSWCYTLETIVSSLALFQNLDELKVDHCGGVVNIITPSIAPCLPNLRILSVSYCEKLKEIVGSNDKENAPCEITFMKLEELELKYLTKLTSFCNGSYNFNFPSMKILCIKYCPVMETLCHGKSTTPSVPLALFTEKVAMPKLETLELSCINAGKIWDIDELSVHLYNTNLMSLTMIDCQNLTSLFSYSSGVRVVEKLKHLEIHSCHKLVVIFAQQEEVTFPELETLVINKMDHLELIWHNRQAPKSFCNLKEIQITGCDALHRVFPFDVAKGLQQLQVLEIYTSENIENIVEESDSQDVMFDHLEKLVVSECHKLKTILQSTVFCQTSSLHILNISNCKKLEQVFGHNNKGDGLGEIAFKKLEELKLKDLPILTIFCKENINFPSLRTIHVIECPSMKTFGHGWKGEHSQKDDELNNLSLTSALFGHGWKGEYSQKDDELNNLSLTSALFDEKVAMPNLEILELSYINSRKIWDDKLPVHLYCQNLTNMVLRGCRSIVSLFSSTAATALVKLRHLEILTCPVLVEIFSQQNEVTFPNLETLVIRDMKGLESIWNNQQAPSSFCKLNKIEITGCEALHHVFPISVAKEVQQLQVLEISTSSIKRIVEERQSRDVKESQSHDVEESQSHDVKKAYFEKLTIYKCDKLKTIVQSSVVFQTLAKLEVKSCAELINIIMPSMSTNLPSLSTLSIYGCPKLEQIFGSGDKGDAPGEIASVKKEELKSESKNKGDDAQGEIASMRKEELKSESKNKGDDAQGEIASKNVKELKPGSGNKGDAPVKIVFTKLEELNLEDLPKITSFSKASYSFNFPGLQRVRVIKCPDMYTFCNGDLITPNLSKVRYRHIWRDDVWREDDRWDGDLNTTLERIAKRFEFVIKIGKSPAVTI